MGVMGLGLRITARDVVFAVILLVVSLLVLRLPFLSVDGIRVLWTGGGILIGALAAVPVARWWIYIAFYVVGAGVTLQQGNWSMSAAVFRVLVDLALSIGAAIVLNRTGWLRMRSPSAVMGVLAVAVIVGGIRAGSLLAATGIDPTRSAVAEMWPIVLLASVLALLTAAPLVALAVQWWDGRHSEPRFSWSDIGPVIGVVVAVAAVLVAAGPVAGDMRVAVLLFPLFAYAALVLPGVVLAAVLMAGSIGWVAFAQAFLGSASIPGVPSGAATTTLALLLPVALALMVWIVFAIAASERQSASRVSSMLHSLLDPHVLLEPVLDSSGTVVDFRFVDANESAINAHLVQRSGLIGARLSDVAPAEVEGGMMQHYVSVLVTGDPVVLDGYPLADEARAGEVRSFDLRAVKVAEGVLVTWRDVTDREAEAARVAQREQQFRLLAENAMDTVFYLGADDLIRWVSPSVEAVLGYAPEELVGRVGTDLMNPDDLPALAAADPVGRAGRPVGVRLRLRAKSGDERWFEATLRGLLDDDGTPTGGVIVVRDVDAEVSAQQALAREVSFDSLTGLPRRPLAVERIQGALQAHSGREWFLLIAGVDGLAAINTAYGFEGGDTVLKTVADRLSAAVGDRGMVARVAGDEFAVILDGLTDATAITAEAKELLDAVRGSVTVDDLPIRVTVRIGIAPAHGQDAESLLAEGTAAVRQATIKGPDRWEFLDGDVSADSRQRLAGRERLRRALDEGRVQAWFMPVVQLCGDADAPVDRECALECPVLGYEALARWVADDGSIIPPTEFLPDAEASGLMVDLDRAILRQSLEAATQLPSDQIVAVNISGRTLLMVDLPTWIGRELRDLGIDPVRLHLEVTETALLHLGPTVIDRMRAVADLGVQWWVDDFGTGFSSVSHLRDLPVGGLKLDRSFTAEIGQGDGRGTRLAEGLAGLAHGLGLGTVAEGVEDVEQARMLRDQGWQWAQGWLFGRAVPLADLLARDRLGALR